MSKDLRRLGACETAAAIRAGDVSRVDAVQAAVDRMRAADPALNAVTVDLLAQAIENATGMLTTPLMEADPA